MELKEKYRKFKTASQAEILRSHQRDDDFIKHLREKVIDLLQILGKEKRLLPIIHSDIPFKLIYFFFTSGMGNQTLGEEYTGIVQTNLDAYKVPSLFVRTLKYLPHNALYSRYLHDTFAYYLGQDVSGGFRMFRRESLVKVVETIRVVR